MKIENEIKQSKFKNAFQKATINILFTNNWINNQFNHILKPYGISQQQYNILRILKGQYPKPCGIKLLIERMLDKNSNASRLVDKLLIKKLVFRTECPDDRRKVNIVITDKGLQLLEECSLETAKLKTIENNLTEIEAEQLSNLLDKLRG